MHFPFPYKRSPVGRYLPWDAFFRRKSCEKSLLTLQTVTYMTSYTANSIKLLLKQKTTALKSPQCMFLGGPFPESFLNPKE